MTEYEATVSNVQQQLAQAVEVAGAPVGQPVTSIDPLDAVILNNEPVSMAGIQCPTGQKFSQCRSHCQARCGDSGPIVCDRSCRPGCVCSDETHYMWEDGTTCAPMCLVMKTTAAPRTPPPACRDTVADCETLIQELSCENENALFFCAKTCKDKTKCGDFFETTTAPPR